MSDKIHQRNYSDLLQLFGQYYQNFGLPSLCGWIEAVLIINSKPLSQQEITDEIKHYITSEDNPTSISSVNRGLKLFEDYHYIKKEGTRKLGYKYSISYNSDIFTSILQMFVSNNLEFESKLKDVNKTIPEDNKIHHKIGNMLSKLNFFSEQISKFLIVDKKKVD